MDTIKNQSPSDELPGPEHIFYDGDCGVCHWAVSFVARCDPQGRTFRFAPLGGSTFHNRLSEQERADLPDSMLVHTRHGDLLMKSQGMIYILRQMGAFWRLSARILWLIPLPLRDIGYDLFARYRKRWVQPPAGVCPVLPAELRTRFDP